MLTVKAIKKSTESNKSCLLCESKDFLYEINIKDLVVVLCEKDMVKLNQMFVKVWQRRKTS